MVDFNCHWLEAMTVFAQQKTGTKSELPLISNFCAQISETAERKQSAIPLSES